MLERLRRSLKASQRSDIGPEIPEEVFNVRVYFFAFLASFAAVICGYDTGFIGAVVVLKPFKDEFGLSEMSPSKVTLVNSNIISIFHVGAFFGALAIYPIGEKFGRKTSLFVSGFLLTFGAAISLIADSARGLGPIYASRVITGIGVGFASGITPMYIGEIAPSAIRGQLTGMWEILWQIGALVGYWINYGVSKHVRNPHQQWIIPFAIQIIPSGVFWLGSCFLPESPRWLISKDQKDKATQKLCFLSTLSPDHDFVKKTINELEAAISLKRELCGDGIFQQIKTVFGNPRYLRRLALSTNVFALQNSAGINAVTYYSVTVFKAIGILGSSAGLMSTGIFGIIKFVSAFFWLFFIVDAWGRRAAFFYGCIPCAITMWYIGAFVKIIDPSNSTTTDTSPAGKGALAMFYIWTFAYGACFNGTCWVYCSELFDQNVRSLVSAVNAASNWFWAFIFARFTGNMFDAMGYGAFFLFAGCMTVAPIIIYVCFPETKGVPLEAIDYLFEVPAWRARKYAVRKVAEDEKAKELRIEIADDSDKTV